ncbi:MAG TPA: hypothetical protein VFK74_02690, partial [Azospira sp.]|nr:hypothetical protein [Azospira sp.]
MKAVLERLGLPGVAGLGLLLFCLSFFFGSVQPLQEEQASLAAEKTQLTADIARQLAASPAPGAGSAPSPLAVAPELLKQLNALAEKHGIAVERTSYVLKDKEGPLRLEVSMPLKVGYPALRAYLRDALALPAGTL